MEIPADLVGPHQPAGPHMIGIGDRENHVSLIGARPDLLTHSVHRQGQEFPLWGFQHRPGPDDQLIAGKGLLHQPGRLIGHDPVSGSFQNLCGVHRILSSSQRMVFCDSILTDKYAAGKQPFLPVSQLN